MSLQLIIITRRPSACVSFSNTLPPSLLRKRGIDVSGARILVYVNVSTGLQHQVDESGTLRLAHHWAEEEQAVPIDLLVVDPEVYIYIYVHTYVDIESRSF